MTGYAAAATAVFALACTGPVRLVHRQPCPSRGLEFRPSPELAVPHPEHLFIPPMPVPASAAKSRIVVRVVVDTSGRVMRDSVTVCGMNDPLYAQRIAEEFAEMRFRPGLLHAKHVISPALLVYEF